MIHTKINIICSFLLFLFSLSSQGVFAQDVPSQREEAQTEENSSEEIPAEEDIVPAQIVADESRGVQTDTPNAETVIELEEIENRQASSFIELMDSIPNVSMLNGAMPQGASLNIRGLGSVAGALGVDGRIAMVIDGVPSGAESAYRNNGIFALEPELFRKVKVERGPSEGFKYKSGAIAGTVSTEVKDASDFLEDGDHFSFRQKLSYETNGSGKLTTSILSWAPIKNFDLLLFYGKREVGNRNDGGGSVIEYSGFEMPSYVAKANYYFSPESKVTFANINSKVPEKDVAFDAFGGYERTFGNADRLTEDETSYIEYKYNPIANDMIDARFQLSHKKETLNFSNYSIPMYESLLIAPNLAETISLQLSNQSSFSHNDWISHSLTIGAEVRKLERESPSDLLGGQNLAGAPGGTDDSFSIYVVDKVLFGEDFTLKPQLRFENQKLTSQGNMAVDTRNKTTPVPDGTTHSSNAWTGGFSTNYKVKDSLSVFGNLYYNENMPILTQFRQTYFKEIEKAVVREIGIAYDNSNVLESDENEIKAKLTLFEKDIYQARQPRDNKNFESIYLKGLEFELSYIHANFYLDFNMGIVRGTINGTSDYFNEAPPTSFQLTLGKYFMDKQLNIMVEPRRNMAQNRTSGSVATAPSDPWTTINISSTYKPQKNFFKGYEFRASIENVADAEYQPYFTTRTALGRNIKLSIAKTF